MTLQQAAQQALDCQNACNLSGVLRSFDRIVMDVLWEEARRIGEGTEWVNSHPICTLFLDKLADLNRRADALEVWDAVEELAKIKAENAQEVAA